MLIRYIIQWYATLHWIDIIQSNNSLSLPRDPYDMNNLYTLTETVSEISSMLLLHSANLLVTGNDDGTV
jgi:hypothetical protein